MSIWVEGHSGEGDSASSAAAALAAAAKFDCVPLILLVMDERRLALRSIAAATGLKRSRLGVLLHRDPAKRQTMTLLEYHTILEALGIDPLDALIRLEPLRVGREFPAKEYATLITMLCDMFRGLTGVIIDALEQDELIDGSEVRREWAPALRSAVAKRVVHEMNAVAVRRSAMSDITIFR